MSPATPQIWLRRKGANLSAALLSHGHPDSLRVSRCLGSPKSRGLGRFRQRQEKTFAFSQVWDLNPLPSVSDTDALPNELTFGLTKDVLFREVPKPFEPQNASRPHAFLARYSHSP